MRLLSFTLCFHRPWTHSDVHTLSSHRITNTGVTLHVDDSRSDVPVCTTSRTFGPGWSAFVLLDAPAHADSPNRVSAFESCSPFTSITACSVDTKAFYTPTRSERCFNTRTNHRHHQSAARPLATDASRTRWPEWDKHVSAERGARTGVEIVYMASIYSRMAWLAISPLFSSSSHV